MCRFSDVDGRKNFSIPDINVGLTSQYKTSDNSRKSVEQMAVEAKSKPQVM
jgi:hypothetical protein